MSLQPVAGTRHHGALAAETVSIVVRRGSLDDANTLFKLVTDNLEEGHLLARSFEEIRRHVARFFVAEADGEIVACAELAPLSSTVAEVRSLVVEAEFRSLGVGAQILKRLRMQARADGYHTLCAFTHAPAYFVHHGFSIVPHVWLPEKIQTDCRTCALFMRCGQQAVVLPLDAAAPAALDV